MILGAYIHLQVDHTIDLQPFFLPSSIRTAKAQQEEANVNYHPGGVLGNNIAVFHISENRASYRMPAR